MRNVVCMRRLLLMATASALALLTKYLVRPARTTAASAAGSLHDTDAPHNTDALHNTDAAPCSAAARADARLRNPVFDLLPSGVRVRDPAVRLAHGTFELSEGRWRTGAHYELYFTHYRGDPKHMWSGKAAYTVQMVRTTDWLEFSVAETVTPDGFVSPDAPLEWLGSTVLAFQAYPDLALGGKRSGLFFSRRESAAGQPPRWSAPKAVLQEVLDLEWNSAHRAIVRRATEPLQPQAGRSCGALRSSLCASRPPAAVAAAGPHPDSRARGRPALLLRGPRPLVQRAFCPSAPDFRPAPTCLPGPAEPL